MILYRLRGINVGDIIFIILLKVTLLYGSKVLNRKKKEKHIYALGIVDIYSVISI